MGKIKFGSETTREILDKEGSHLDTTTNFRHGQPLELKRYEKVVRKRVKDLEGELKMYREFATMIHSNKNYFDAAFEVSGQNHESNPEYTVVMRYRYLAK